MPGTLACFGGRGSACTMARSGVGRITLQQLLNYFAQKVVAAASASAAWSSFVVQVASKATPAAEITEAFKVFDRHGDGCAPRVVSCVISTKLCRRRCSAPFPARTSRMHSHSW